MQGRNRSQSGARGFVGGARGCRSAAHRLTFILSVHGASHVNENEFLGADQLFHAMKFRIGFKHPRTQLQIRIRRRRAEK